MQRRRFLASAGAATVATVVSAGCLGLGPSSDSYDVGMTAQAFRPETITISVGEEVVWKNISTRAHSVTAYEGTLPDGAAYFATGEFETETAAREAWEENGGVIHNGETYAHRFETPGEHPYYCIPHETAGMVGKVIVEE
jgi:plastocyanin